MPFKLVGLIDFLLQLHYVTAPWILTGGRRVAICVPIILLLSRVQRQSWALFFTHFILLANSLLRAKPPIVIERSPSEALAWVSCATRVRAAA
jgi:hypothetical protein